MDNSNKPTESEYQILEILWTKGPSSVRLVNEAINQTKETGYTTTLKIMQIMHEKGLVERDTSSRSHIYKAALSEDKTRNQMLQSFLDKTFKGSAMSLVMQTLGNHQTSQEELKQIKDLISKLEDKH